MTTPRLDHSFFDNEVRPHFGAVLLQTKLLRPDQLDQALDLQRNSGKRLGQLLIDLGWLYEQDIARAIAIQSGLPYIDLEASSVDPRAAAKLRPELGKEMRAIPVRFAPTGLLVAVADPLDAPHARLVEATGHHVERCIGEPSVILAMWGRLLRGERL